VACDVRKRPIGSFDHPLASPPVASRPARPGVGRSESGAKSRPACARVPHPRGDNVGVRVSGPTGPVGLPEFATPVAIEGPCRASDSSLSRRSQLRATRSARKALRERLRGGGQGRARSDPAGRSCMWPQATWGRRNLFRPSDPIGGAVFYRYNLSTEDNGDVDWQVMDPRDRAGSRRLRLAAGLWALRLLPGLGLHDRAPAA
jgi:hypothetical protein